MANQGEEKDKKIPTESNQAKEAELTEEEIRLQISKLQEKLPDTPAVEGSNIGVHIGNAIKEALISVENGKTKPESIRVQEQVDEIAQMKRNQLQDLSTNERDPIGYDWVKTGKGGVKIKSTEAHFVHVKVSKKEHDPIKKMYEEKSKVLMIYPHLYAGAVLSGRFSPYDKQEIIHDPRTDSQKTQLINMQSNKK